VFTIVYQVLRDDYIGMVVSAAVGVAATVSLHLSCKQYNRPTTYGVWLFPYVPAASVGLNCFLLGQLKTAAYERFGIWTAFVTRKCLGVKSSGHRRLACEVCGGMCVGVGQSLLHASRLPVYGLEGFFLQLKTVVACCVFVPERCADAC
jgi:hypothetical protein